ncbi:MAG: CD225/dispanin family protein [Stenotrophomonas sp.]|uniref:CD225/dispanin family protein n=1 Tax=Stenotrophomonas sp. TaxID=69392 RepID=UPI003D6D391F
MNTVPPPYASQPSGFNGPIPTHLAWSIVVTVLSFLVCCVSCYSFPGIITGIVAIVYASKVKSLLNAGDLAGAERASRSAKTWSWVTTGILVLAVIIGAISFAYMGSEGYMEQIEQIRRQIEAAQ